MTTLSLPAARALHLHAQNMLTPPRRKANKSDILDCIRHMAALQIDTISVVARSPYLVLWSRLGHYPQNWLDELLAEGKLFEYWSHEACFLPVEDYALYRHQMLSPESMGWKFSGQFLRENATLVQSIRDHISHNGASRSADFDRKHGKGNGWWDWKPEKRSLEVLFTLGELMVARRDKFQRIYDLRERVLPHWDDQRHLPQREHCLREQVLKSVRALGIAKASWIADYFRMNKDEASHATKALLKNGALLQVSIDNWKEPAYVHPDHADALQQAIDGTLKATATRLLSPFDPIVWDRKRALELFDFDYRLECYTPAEKRRYGYFTLPILRRGQLIGRADMKAHRQAGIMEIKSLHLEQKIKPSAALIDDLAKQFRQFAEWHQTPELQFPEIRGDGILEKLGEIASTSMSEQCAR